MFRSHVHEKRFENIEKFPEVLSNNKKLSRNIIFKRDSQRDLSLKVSSSRAMKQSGSFFITEG
jgi:hypothetical protein